MTFIETKIFTQQINSLMGDSEYRILQKELLADPKAGHVIEHSGGLRKIRFGIKGKGGGKEEELGQYTSIMRSKLGFIFLLPAAKMKKMICLQRNLRY